VLGRIEIMDRRPRRLTSVAIGVVAFVAAYVFLFPTGCAAADGVPSWERCITVIGTPAFSLTDWGIDNTFDILIPLAIGIPVGLVTSWLLGRRTQAAHND